MKKFKENPEKTIYWLLFIIVICTMLPVWYLGRYAVPSLDDYYFGQMPHQAWLATHSIKEVVKGACDMVNFYYFAKQATFSSIFLMSLFPGVLDEKWYFFTPLIMTGMLMLSTTAFVHTVVGDCLGVKDRFLTGIINLLIIFLTVQTMLVPLEGIYWYNGALHYVFMQSVMYFEIACILHFIHATEKKTKVWTIIVSSLLGVIVGGGNLITGLQACILVVIYIVLMICEKAADKNELSIWAKLGLGSYDKSNYMVLIPGIITILSYLVNICAPGNAKRQGVEVQMNPIKAVVESFYWGAVHAISWVTPMMIVVFVIVAVVIWKLAAGNDRRFMNPILLLIISYCVFAAMFTPTFYATSMDAPDRVKNIICIAENILIFINIANDIGYCRSSLYKKTNMFTTMMDATENKVASIIIGGVIIVLIIFILPENKNEYTSMSAVRSILTQDAARYYYQSQERIRIYNDDTQKDIVIHKLTEDAKPYLLFKEDISSEEGEEGFWQSIEIADYYAKESITVID